ncbi:enoyl-CoA hydratase/isomerase family protein [Bradyrhizobium manausense]|uniref:enoyl-CoA hydratase/isomerase family protein n=1 Tax=Bradyrhizobium manausense TaxID=989370 RepID=UPI001BA72AD1|nr:enoyl-CoA hydratase/isomerase family protein [Bradyrhizobium manausense]
MEQVVLLDRPAPSVARLRINRPAKRNAIDHAVRQGFIDVLADLRGDPSVRALVLGGVDGVFSAGGDLPTMANLNYAQAEARMQHVHAVCRALAESGLSIVSALEGVVAGAAVGMALLGDHIVVGRRTQILFPFLRLGLVPDWGQLFTLRQRVNKATAWRLVTSPAPVTGEEAFTIGLADQLVADDDIMKAAIMEASRLSQLPIEALRRTRERLSDPSRSLDDELAREARDQAVCLTGSEFAEGYAAFMEKRAADFLELAPKDQS